MKIWAHRGCSQRYPENTLLAFEKAIELKKLTGIELDIHLMKDGNLAVIHDPSLKRTAGVDVEIEDLTTEDLKKYL